MKRTARLTLKKETLTALAADDLVAVAGAADATALTCYTCLQPRCFVIAEPSLQEVTDCCAGIPTLHGGC